MKRKVGQVKFEKLKASYAIKKEEKNLRNLIEDGENEEEEKQEEVPRQEEVEKIPTMTAEPAKDEQNLADEWGGE